MHELKHISVARRVSCDLSHSPPRDDTVCLHGVMKARNIEPGVSASRYMKVSDFLECSFLCDAFSATGPHGAVLVKRFVSSGCRAQTGLKYCICAVGGEHADSDKRGTKMLVVVIVHNLEE